MKPHSLLMTVCFSVAAVPAVADDTCPWAGGEYAFSDHGIYGDFVVNDDCTEMTWSRIADNDETTALVRTKNGWAGELEKVAVVLRENGTDLQLTAYGGVSRSSDAERKN